MVLKNGISLILILVFKQTVCQPFYGLSFDEKFSLKKNRVGFSLFRQDKKNGKLGLSVNYNYSSYTYPSSITKLNNSGTGYVSESTSTPPYWRELGANTTSILNGFTVEAFDNMRLKTFKKSNLDMKITLGYGYFSDKYTTEFFGKKKTGNFNFSLVMCNLYFGYLIWYKNIGLEPILGIAYYYPLLIDNHYLSSNPFVAAEIEAGISFYYQKNKKHQR